MTLILGKRHVKGETDPHMLNESCDKQHPTNRQNNILTRDLTTYLKRDIYLKGPFNHSRMQQETLICEKRRLYMSKETSNAETLHEGTLIAVFVCNKRSLFVKR